MPRVAALLAFVLSLVGAAPPGLAAPRLAVRARATLTELTATSKGLSVDLEGVLRDNLAQPVPGATVQVNAPPSPVFSTRTATDGRFDLRFDAAAEGALTLRVHFVGTPQLAEASAELAVFIGRTAVELSADVPSPTPADRPVRVEIRARDGAGRGTPGLLLETTIDDQALPPTFTGRSGVAALTLSALSPGPHRLFVRAPGDSERLPAELSVSLMALADSSVTLTYAGPTPVSHDLPLVFEGRVSPANGQRVDVLLTADGAPVGETATDELGRWRREVESGRLPAGEVVFRALALPRDAGYREAASPELRLTIPPAPPPSPAWTWVPVGLGLSALVGALVRQRRRVAPPTVVEAPPPPPALCAWTPDPAVEAVVVSLVDASSGQPVDGLVALLLDPGPAPRANERPDAPVSATTGGVVALRGPGTRLWAFAPGFAPACHPCSVPPGGRASVRMISIPARVQVLFTDLLLAAGRPPVRFGRDTPREAGLALAARTGESDAVLALVTAVERACFGTSPPDLDGLAQVEVLVEYVAARLRPARTRA